MLARPARRSAEAFPTTEPASSHVLPPRRLAGHWVPGSAARLLCSPGLAHNFPEPHLPCLKDENGVGIKTKPNQDSPFSPPPPPQSTGRAPDDGASFHTHKLPRARAHLRKGKWDSGRSVALTRTTRRAGQGWRGAEDAVPRRLPSWLRLGQGAWPSARGCSRDPFISPHADPPPARGLTHMQSRSPASAMPEPGLMLGSRSVSTSMAEGQQIERSTKEGATAGEVRQRPAGGMEGLGLERELGVRGLKGQGRATGIRSWNCRGSVAVKVRWGGAWEGQWCHEQTCAQGWVLFKD